MSRLSLRALLAIVAAFLFLAVPAMVHVYTDWLWFGETGYRQVFLRSISTQVILGAAAAALTAVLWLGNLRLTFTELGNRRFLLPVAPGARPVALDLSGLTRIAYIVATIGAILVGAYASTRWEAFLLYRHAAAFGLTDPILGRDVGYYVFRLPFLQFLQGLSRTILGLALAAAAAGYLLRGDLALDARARPMATRSARRHLALLGAGLLLVLAWGSALAIPTLLTEPSGIVYGASNVDVEARIPGLRFAIGAALVGVVLALYQTVSSRLWPAFTAVAILTVVTLAGNGYASLVQRLLVAPNEQARETPYILHNIAATRHAFAIDQVTERELSGDSLLTRADIDANAATLKNVPLWDHQPLLDTFGQLQEIRTYYDFVSVDNDRYRIDGEDRQVMLSAREVNTASLPNRNWINERLTFTHGYGLTLGPVNQVTPEGLPVLFIKDLPPESSVRELEVTEPSIYFGELSSDHVFVNTTAKEFHYPKGDDNVTSTYAGEGGVAVDDFFRRLLFAIRFRSLKILLSNDLGRETRVLFHRPVAERVAKIAPFLAYDPDPYLSLDRGRLYWIQDAYTRSNRYPYSTPIGGINYIRNSVKVVIDAYHGRTTYYRIDERDPVAETYARAFPGLFRPLAEMPDALRSRLRYPETIFSIQAEVFATFHMANPAVFYNKEDQWEVPAIDGAAGQSVRMQPYYTIMKLPGEQTTEFIQMLSFTPKQKDNLAAWMVARSDGSNYGQLMVFQFPKQKVVFGPRQVVARINQDQVISPQLTLWNQQGSQVIQGTLLVIPIGESLIYIRPLYLRAAGGRITELKRVIVAHQNQIVMEESLEAALARIFPGPPPVLPASPPLGDSAPAPLAVSPAAKPAAAAPAGMAVTAPAGLAILATRAQEQYRAAIAAQRAGDWARYGEEIERLGATLEEMGRR